MVERPCVFHDSLDFMLWISVSKMGLVSICKHTAAETHLIKKFIFLTQVTACPTQAVPSKPNALNCVFLLAMILNHLEESQLVCLHLEISLPHCVGTE